MVGATTPSKDKYEFRSATISQIYQHNVGVEDFQELISSRDFLLEYMAFEEALLQVLYAEQIFEEMLLTSALDHHLRPLQEFDYLQDVRLKGNLLILGFLSSMTSLRDQLPKFEKKMIGPSRAVPLINFWNDLADASISFSFCERLRNYAQHQGQPIYSVTSGGGWTSEGLLESHLTLYGLVDDICDQGRSVVTEAAAYRAEFGDRVELALIVRESFGLVCDLGKRVRGTLTEAFDRAAGVYDRNLAILSGYVDGQLLGHAVHTRAGNIVQEFSIFEDFIGRARRLRNGHLTTNSQAHYVSNRARGHSSGKNGVSSKRIKRR